MRLLLHAHERVGGSTQPLCSLPYTHPWLHPSLVCARWLEASGGGMRRPCAAVSLLSWWRSDFVISWTGATREVDGCDAGCRGGLLLSGGWRHPWQVRLGQPSSLCPGHARLSRPLAARLAVASRHACARPCMRMDASACVCSRCATSPVLTRAWIHRGCVSAGCSRAEASRGGRAGLARPRAHAHPCVARFMTYFFRCGRT